MTRPLFEPSTQRGVAGNTWGISQLQRRPAERIAENTADIDGTWAYGFELQEDLALIYRALDDNAYWATTAQRVRGTYTYRPTTLLSTKADGIKLGTDPDTSEPTVFLSGGALYNMWSVHSPLYETDANPNASQNLVNVWAKAHMYAYDGSANQIDRVLTGQVVATPEESEDNQNLSIQMFTQFISADPVLDSGDPVAPIRIFYTLTVEWLADEGTYDETSAESFVVSQIPTDTIMYVSLAGTGEHA